MSTMILYPTLKQPESSLLIRVFIPLFKYLFPVHIYAVDYLPSVVVALHWNLSFPKISLIKSISNKAFDKIETSYAVVTLLGSSIPSKLVNLEFTIFNFWAWAFIKVTNYNFMAFLVDKLNYFFIMPTTIVHMASLAVFKIAACINSVIDS